MKKTKRLHLAKLGLIGLLIMTMLVGCSQSSQTPPASSGANANKEAKEIVIAEPLHSIGYLPLYVAIEKGLFEGVNVKVTTLTGGSAHTNAVLSGEAWAFIGGPEHNAFAKAKGADLRAIVNVVNRGNVYFVARPGLAPQGDDIKSFLKGKTIVTSAYGGTPNSITRYVINQEGLDITADVKLQEVDNNAIPSIIQQKQGDIAVVTEPILTKGINEGIWQKPFYDAPKELGPYAYSTINVKLETLEKDPETVKAFTRGMVKGLEFVRDHKEESLAIAQKEFPTMTPDILKATLDRSYVDELWEYSGAITPESVVTNLAVVKNAGMLKEDIKYEEIIDTKLLGQ